jgi:hypothetical protein
MRVHNISALSRAIHISSTVIRNWSSRPDWPFGPPPWAVEAVRKWAATTLSLAPAAVTDAGIRVMAKALSVSPDAVINWSSRPDWPFGPPPWSLENVQKWVSRGTFATVADALVLTSDASRDRAELLQIIARARLLVLQNAEQAGNLHDAKACQARHLGQIAAVKGQLQRLPGLIERQLQDEIAKMLKVFAEGET